jgi:glutathionyl-hydroquinone reductase
MMDKDGSFFGYQMKNGEFERPETRFRQWIRADGSTPFAAEAGRYHLYVSLACPWSHRTVLVRKLRKLESAISMSVTSPIWNENGWTFGSEPGTVPDLVNGKRDVIDLYRLVDPSFDQPETVPILWDKRTGTIVNNESREIMRMLDHEMRALGDPGIDLCPPDLQGAVEAAIDRMYSPINNGVYIAGFSRHQRPYERAVTRLFAALDDWERELSTRRYVCGEHLTEADLSLFVTLIRFDAVYYTHFKCNLRRIQDYPSLSRWLKQIYRTPGVAETCSFEHIKKHYFGSHREINPTGIVPMGPLLDLG